MKRFFILAIVLINTLTFSSCGDDDEKGNNDEVVYTDSFMGKLQGNYEELFPVMLQSKWDIVWDTLCVKYAGANAEALKSVLKGSFTETEYGEEVSARKIASGEMTFDCFFENGLKEFRISGNTISGYDANNKLVFSHEYESKGLMPYVEYPSFSFHVYQSKDGNNDEFKYFVFTDDCIQESFHLEFRYGSDLDALRTYYSGKYGYWLASAIQKEPSDKLVYDVIDLFIKENAE